MKGPSEAELQGRSSGGFVPRLEHFVGMVYGNSSHAHLEGGEDIDLHVVAVRRRLKGYVVTPLKGARHLLKVLLILQRRHISLVALALPVAGSPPFPRY